MEMSNLAFELRMPRPQDISGHVDPNGQDETTNQETPQKISRVVHRTKGQCRSYRNQSSKRPQLEKARRSTQSPLSQFIFSLGAENLRCEATSRFSLLNGVATHGARYDLVVILTFTFGSANPEPLTVTEIGSVGGYAAGRHRSNSIGRKCRVAPTRDNLIAAVASANGLQIGRLTCSGALRSV